MATIERRLEALEAHRPDIAEFMLILRRIVTLGRPTGEAETAEFMGQRWTREPTETEAAFIERIRVYAEANRKTGQHAIRVILDAAHSEQREGAGAAPVRT